MKQKSSAPSFLIFMLSALIIIGNASATAFTFPLCYGGCILKCKIFGSKTPCVMDCLLKCYKVPTESPQIYYRNLGCAVSNCVKNGNGTLSLSPYALYSNILVNLLYFVLRSCFYFTDTKAVHDCVTNCETGKY